MADEAALTAVAVTDAQADAIKALAETTGTALELIRGVGAYVADTIGTVPKDILGLVGGDWAHERRLRNLAAMQAKTVNILQGFARDRLSEPSLSLVVPLLDQAKDEGRSEIQELWAALLANAMIDNGRRVRRVFFELVGKLEPPDVVALRGVRSIPLSVLAKQAYDAYSDANQHLLTAFASTPYGENDLEISLRTLEQLGLIKWEGLVPPKLTPLATGLFAVLELKEQA